MIDLDFVRGLIEAVDNSGIDSIEITRAGTRIRIGKTPPVTATYAAAPAGPASQVTGPIPQPGTASESAAGTGATEESGGDATSGLTEIKSPMVGTFYRAPAPEAPPYVEVGSRVSQGQTLCILEAMKLMNELESEMDGLVREILVKNAEPVEYGQVLFRIEPT